MWTATGKDSAKVDKSKQGIKQQVGQRIQWVKAPSFISATRNLSGSL